jgi:protein SCO1/2
MFRPYCLSFALALASCGRVAPPLERTENAATYQVRGVVQKVDVNRGTALIAHEEIPGYMEAMTMTFTAARAADLTDVQPGDVLAFRLVVTETQSRIDAIRRTGTAPVSAPKAEASGPEPGSLLPDVVLVTASGRTFRLMDELRGKTTALTFIFTRCPLPDYCPRLTNHFSAVQRELATRAPDTAWQLLSVTIDPAYDTPERLAAYAAQHGADATRWIFATGEVSALGTLAAFFGLAVSGEGAALSHNLRTAIVDADGRVQKIFPGNAWSRAELAAALVPP